MNQKQVKLLRGQIRQIVKELLPSVLSTEAIKAIAHDLNKAVSARLDIIDERQKDISAYVVRNSAGIGQVPTGETNTPAKE